MPTAPSDFAQRTRRKTATRSWPRTAVFCALLALLASVCGCKSWPWRFGAVPDSVASCRDLSTQALTAIERGDWQQAEGLLNRAVSTCPVDTDARRYYAEVLVQRGAASDAVSQLEKARKLSPHDVGLTIRAGEMYLANGNLEMAERRAVEAIRLDNRSPEAWALRGRARLASSDHAGALSDLQRGLGFRPNDPGLLRQIAEIHLGHGRADRALLYVQALSDTFLAADLPPDVLQLQARTYMTLGRYREAASCYRLACQAMPPAAENYYALAQAELRAGSPSQAEMSLHQALSIQPQHQASRQLLDTIAQLNQPGARLR